MTLLARPAPIGHVLRASSLTPTVSARSSVAVQLARRSSACCDALWASAV